MSLDLEALGITREELQDRVVERIANALLTSGGSDDEGRGYFRESDLKLKLDAQVQQAIDTAIATFAEKHVLPNVAQLVEGMTLQETTKWGEKRGAPKTFVEYLTERADAYLREEVNHDGKTKSQDSSYFRANGTRIAYLVDKHLQHSIQTAMDGAVKTANESIKEGLAEAVKVSLNKIVTGLKVTVEQKHA